MAGSGNRRGAADGRAGLDRLVDALGLVSGVLLCVLTALIVLDVVVQNFRLFPMPWTLDVAEYLLYVITFLGAPWVLRDRGHIAIDLVVENLGPVARRRAAFAANAVGAAVCALLLFYSTWTWWRSFSSGTRVYETFVFPEWYLLVLAPLVFALLFAIFARWLWRPGEQEKSASGI